MIIQGDALDVLRTLDTESVDCIVTSPPYYAQREYGAEGQIGQEPTPQEFIARLVEVFRECRRVLKKSGTCWVNMGDTYAGSWNGQGGPSNLSVPTSDAYPTKSITSNAKRIGFKRKELMMMPARLAIALSDDGWYLRSDIIWSKPNPMPKSVKDRPTDSHEYIFLLTKSPRYWYDADAIAEPVTESTIARLSQPTLGEQVGSTRANGGAKTNGNMKAVGKVPHGWASSKHYDGADPRYPTRLEVPDDYKGSVPGRKDGPGQDRRSNRDRVRGSKGASGPPQEARRPGDSKQHDESHLASASQRMGRALGWRQATPDGLTRNARSVWTFSTTPYKGNHYATFPEELPRRCILAGCPEGGLVLDPFAGTGTTVAVALKLGRRGIGIELNPDYVGQAHARLSKVTPSMFMEEAS